jgi:hypothetical protein
VWAFMLKAWEPSHSASTQTQPLSAVMMETNSFDAKRANNSMPRTREAQEQSGHNDRRHRNPHLDHHRDHRPLPSQDHARCLVQSYLVTVPTWIIVVARRSWG